MPIINQILLLDMRIIPLSMLRQRNRIFLLNNREHNLQSSKKVYIRRYNYQNCTKSSTDYTLATLQNQKLGGAVQDGLLKE